MFKAGQYVIILNNNMLAGICQKAVPIESIIKIHRICNGSAIIHVTVDNVGFYQYISLSCLAPLDSITLNDYQKKKR